MTDSAQVTNLPLAAIITASATILGVIIAQAWTRKANLERERKAAVRQALSEYAGAATLYLIRRRNWRMSIVTQLHSEAAMTPEVRRQIEAAKARSNP
jgi:hypothetical protein